MEQKIKIDGEEYILFFENGNPIVKQYDTQYKIWYEMEFVGKCNKKAKQISQYITNILVNEYVESTIN